MSDTARAPAADPAEIAKFDAMAAEWWDPNGPFAPLHAMTPCRLDYVVAQIAVEFGRDRRAPASLDGLRLLDVGCGGGLVAEPMARLGAQVTAIDAAGDTLAVARRHAEVQGLSIAYQCTTAGALADTGARFDTVLALEVIEHVPDPAAFLTECATLLAPGGLLLVSTLNRTGASFAKAIVGAEWVLGWLPRGTHDWRKFLAPETLADLMRASGLIPLDTKGMVYAPLTGDWRLSDSDLSVNYIAAAGKPR